MASNLGTIRSGAVKYLKAWWLIVALVLVLPPVASSMLGFLWLWEHRWLWAFLGGSSVLFAVLVPVVHWLRRQSSQSLARVEPSPLWPPAGDEAWQRVEAIARRVQQEPFSLEHFDDAQRVLHEVLSAVALQFHPRSKQPLLEIPAPYALRIVELALADLRQALTEYVPGAHILTLHDIQRLRNAAVVTRQLYGLYRLVSLGVSPTSSILREIRDLVAGQLMATSADDMRQWALGFCVRKVGYYAIQLYSGQLVLSDVEFSPVATRRTRRDAARAAEVEQHQEEEPLRILVVGQVKAGKSSLINALFGEVRSAVDVVPATRGLTPYVLQRDGLQRAILLDTAGYGAGAGEGEPLEGLRREILQVDLILLVLTAASAARGADRRLLDGLRATFQAAPDRPMPPTVVALTHVDLLRPLAEWQPPYDLQDPSSPKARNMADAVRAVAADLDVDESAVAAVCLKAGMEYNVEEGLVPAMLAVLSEAQRIRALRCLREQHNREYWERLGRQALASGRLLWQAGQGRLEKWLRS